MKVTGYQLREAIKRHQLVRDSAAKLFDDSLKAFPDEEKESPNAIMDRLMYAEEAIALLQVAQQRYNLAVFVAPDARAPARLITLSAAVKLLGGYGRREKMWRSAASPKGKDNWGRTDERSKDTLIAKPTIHYSAAGELAETSARLAAGMRQAIALGNAAEIELEDLSAALFE